jgi:Ser/Thr protein kinase RdoA (MazF antagonist)
MLHNQARAHEALSAYALHECSLEPIVMGNINETYAVHTTGERYILQRLNPIFKPEVHHDIQAITEHLAAAGVTTPRLLPTRANTLWTVDTTGGAWRMMTFIPGVVHSEVSSAKLCHAAGVLLGRFHRTLGTLTHTFAAPRFGVHDTPRHLAGLEHAMTQHAGHMAYPMVRPLAESILAAVRQLPSIHALPPRIVHGDPKIQNIIFAETGEARAMIDLDTLAHMSLPLELGDALRSWCNPVGETRAESVFDLERFAASLRGYAEYARDWLTPDEIAALPSAVETISLELAARFARDALEESYFGWDPRRFSAAWEHHLLRAQGQLTLAQSYAAQRPAAARLLREVFG